MYVEEVDEVIDVDSPTLEVPEMSVESTDFLASDDHAPDIEDTEVDEPSPPTKPVIEVARVQLDIHDSEEEEPSPTPKPDENAKVEQPKEVVDCQAETEGKSIDGD